MCHWARNLLYGKTVKPFFVPFSRKGSGGVAPPDSGLQRDQPHLYFTRLKNSTGEFLASEPQEATQPEAPHRGSLGPGHSEDPSPKETGQENQRKQEGLPARPQAALTQAWPQRGRAPRQRFPGNTRGWSTPTPAAKGTHTCAGSNGARQALLVSSCPPGRGARECHKAAVTFKHQRDRQDRSEALPCCL